MRPLLLLLAAYVLALALVPCGDTVGASPAETGLVAATEASDSDDQLTPSEDTPADDDHHDECTPFCACACCGLQVVVTPRLFLPALPQLVAAPAARPMSAAAAWDNRPLGATSQPPRV